MLPGLMMDYPLTLTRFMTRAKTFFPAGEIVSRLPDGHVHRYTYVDYCARAEKLGKALLGLGVVPGERVATLCWNHYRHLEAYYAVPCIGAVLHTLNLRLHPTELAYIARHAGDSVIIVDRSLSPLLEQFRAELPLLRYVVVLDLRARYGKHLKARTS
jgi:fatty-acyl-CoA synthase